MSTLPCTALRNAALNANVLEGINNLLHMAAEIAVVDYMYALVCIRFVHAPVYKLVDISR